MREKIRFSRQWYWLPEGFTVREDRITGIQTIVDPRGFHAHLMHTADLKGAWMTTNALTNMSQPLEKVMDNDKPSVTS